MIQNQIFVIDMFSKMGIMKEGDAAMLFENINITNIQEILTVPSPRGRVVEIHNRGSYGLSFCLEGQITYTHKGEKYISDTSHAIFLPKGQSYTLYGNKKGMFPLINFDCTDFPLDTFLAVPLQNPEPFIKDFEQMKNLFIFKRNRLKVLSIFYDLLNRLAAGQSREENLLANAMRYLENHISDPLLSNKILAQQIGFSEVYFRKVFSAQFGVSPKQYILDVRMQKAKQLLTDGVLTVTSIAEECGFSSVYHFSRAFKQKTGISPTEYLRQNKILKI